MNKLVDKRILFLSLLLISLLGITGGLIIVFTDVPAPMIAIFVVALVSVFGLMTNISIWKKMKK